TEDTRRLIAMRHEVVRAAAAATARGTATDAVRDLAAGFAPRGAADAWLAWRLYGAPEPADPLVDELAPQFEAFLMRAEEIARIEPVVASGGFSIQPGLPLCGGNPFASGAAGGEGELFFGGGPRP
ncbi:MAG TPA: hypothetical protein VGR27_15035, partial [Longimicrobiaceae bacterium]|nr:hypothetical protein [Longimicrobiaceae bacterium]